MSVLALDGNTQDERDQVRPTVFGFGLPVASFTSLLASITYNPQPGGPAGTYRVHIVHGESGETRTSNVDGVPTGPLGVGQGRQHGNLLRRNTQRAEHKCCSYDPAGHVISCDHPLA